MKNQPQSEAENFVAALEKRAQEISPSQLLKPRDLVELGLFGCTASVHLAISRGHLLSVKISPSRVLVPCKSAIDFVKARTR